MVCISRNKARLVVTDFFVFLDLIIATEIEGTFRVNGSNKRMRELQAKFESPPRVVTFSRR